MNLIFPFKSSCFDKLIRGEDKLTRDQTKHILDNLVLDNVIMEVKSNIGLSEHSAMRIGEVRYKLIGKKSGGGEARAGFCFDPLWGLSTYRALYT